MQITITTKALCLQLLVESISGSRVTDSSELQQEMLMPSQNTYDVSCSDVAQPGKFAWASTMPIFLAIALFALTLCMSSAWHHSAQPYLQPGISIVTFEAACCARRPARLTNQQQKNQDHCCPAVHEEQCSAAVHKQQCWGLQNVKQR